MRFVWCTALFFAFAAHGGHGKAPRAQPQQQGGPPQGPAPLAHDARGPAAAGAARPTALPQQPAAAQPAPVAQVPPRRFGRFDLDQPIAQLAKMPELAACAQALTGPSGRAECALPHDADKLGKLQVAWEDTRPGGEVVALRLLFDAQLAPALTDLEWQLTRGWGPPSLEQLRREHEQKFFTLQWEDGEHRATLEASGALSQPSRAVAVVLERKQLPLGGELAGLRPRPFPGMRLRWLRKIDWEGQPHALLWGTSLTPAQVAMGETGPAWAAQRSYVGLWRLEPATAQRARRWRPLWERTTGDEDEDLQRIVRVEAKDITGDGTPDIEVELSCPTCGEATSELVLKTVRAGKLVDLLSKHDLYRADVEMQNGTVRIKEPEDEGATISTYAYDRGKGAFVLAREERLPGAATDER